MRIAQAAASNHSFISFIVSSSSPVCTFSSLYLPFVTISLDLFKNVSILCFISQHNKLIMFLLGDRALSKTLRYSLVSSSLKSHFLKKCSDSTVSNTANNPDNSTASRNFSGSSRFFSYVIQALTFSFSSLSLPLYISINVSTMLCQLAQYKLDILLIAVFDIQIPSQLSHSFRNWMKSGMFFISSPLLSFLNITSPASLALFRSVSTVRIAPSLFSFFFCSSVSSLCLSLIKAANMVFFLPHPICFLSFSNSSIFLKSLSS